MRKLMRAILVLLAIIFLIEAWLWDKLEPIVERIVSVVPWDRFKAACARWVGSLPPGATLAVFLIPASFGIPFKILGLWLLTHGDWSQAAAVIIAGKFVTLGVTAFVFDMTREKLLQIYWFRVVYDYVIWFRLRAHALVDPIRRRIRYRMRLLSPRRSPRAFRLLMRIRRRIHDAPPAGLREAS